MKNVRIVERKKNINFMKEKSIELTWRQQKGEIYYETE